MDDRTAEALSPVHQDGGSKFASVTLVIYVVAFVTGAIVMSFEMLGSRYLNPYFGSGIYTWAALISTVLAALCVGYFIGGWLADRTPSLSVLGVTVIIGSAYLILLPSFAQAVLEHLLAVIDDIKLGSLASSFAIMFFPVTLLGMYSPFAIRLLMRSPHRSGVVSGTVYGISTAGSIVGTLGTTFYLIPMIGSRAITISLGVAGVVAGLVLLATQRWSRWASAAVALIVVTATLTATVFLAGPARAEELIDLETRKAMLARKNGLIAHIETTYNDIFIAKKQAELTMSFQVRGWEWDQAAINLNDPDDVVFPIMRQMSTAVVYPEEVKKILMIGLGGGMVSTYLARHMPEVTIDVVEIDPGVIDAAKKYFGLRETSRVRFIEADGRVFLKRSQELYDLIILDAFHGGYTPFHLLTKEFYALVKEHLKPNGAAAFNVPSDTLLYPSTIVTLRAVFPTVDLYPAEDGLVITIATPQPGPDQAEVARRAAALQERYAFRFPMSALAGRYLAKLDVSKGVLLTDDFAPAELYNARTTRRKKK